MSTPGNYPNSIIKPYLNEVFHVKKPPSLTLYNSKQLYEIYYPHTSTKMSSYEQVSNNKKYWTNPNNGTALPTGFNNSIYNSF